MNSKFLTCVGFLPSPKAPQSQQIRHIGVMRSIASAVPGVLPYDSVSEKGDTLLVLEYRLMSGRAENAIDGEIRGRRQACIDQPLKFLNI